MEFLKLFVAALMPVVKVLIVTAIGAFIALDRFDILKENAGKHLNTIVYFVFTPALLYSSLAKSLTLRSLIMLWFMPINVILSFVIGTALGRLVIKITRTPHHLQGLVLGCCTAGNVGHVPLILVPAICKESRGAFGAVDVCYRNGLAYVSLAMAVGTIYIWTYVYSIMGVYASKSSNVNKADDSSIISVSTTERDPENLSKCSTGQFVNAEQTSQAIESIDHMGQHEVEHTNGEAKVPKKAKIMKQLKKLAKQINPKALFGPSTSGSFAGIIIGVVPPFRKVLTGDNAPLHVIHDSVSMIGDAAIPAMTLLIGANLLKGLKGSGVQLSLIVAITIVRFIALPAVGVGIVKGAVHFGLIHADPLYQFVLLLQFALPPAIAISTMTQLHGAGEGECSIIMLATYSCAAIWLTLWCTFFVWLVV